MASSPPKGRDLWVCESCRMVGSTAESEAYHVVRGHEVRPLSREQAETIWDEWRRTPATPNPLPNHPPNDVSILFCPVCGRDDRYTPFTGKGHFNGGVRCPGTPETVWYERMTR